MSHPRRSLTVFFVFFAILGVLITSAFAFIQSGHFARVAQRLLTERLPKNAGMSGEFSSLAIKFFPPGLAVYKPRILIGAHNVVDLPEGTSVDADRVDFNFLPFQMFSGTIRVNEIVVVGGDIRLPFTHLGQEPARARKRLDFHWDELLQVRAEAISLQNTKVHLEYGAEKKILDARFENLRFGQREGDGGLGYELTFDLREAHGSLLKSLGPAEKIAEQTENLRGQVFVNAAGIKIDTLEFLGSGLQISLGGAMKGDVRKGTAGLVFEGNVEGKGELETLARLIDRKDLAGQLSFAGNVRVPVDKVPEGIRWEGKLGASHVRFHGWDFDGASAELTYNAGELSVSRAAVSTPFRERVGGVQPGSGGKLEIHPFHFALGGTEPVTVPIELDQVHLHWLLGPTAPKVFGLNLRASGPAAITWTPGPRWSLQSKVNFAIADFQLDNQKLESRKPPHTILKIAKLAVEGDFFVNAQEVRMGNALFVTAPKSRLKVAGKVDYKQGFDLIATGNVSLADVGEIAQLPIAGDGTLIARVHGPAATVALDFDIDTQDAEYLKLKLGTVRGTITWDDGTDQLRFTGMKIDHRRTHLDVDGYFDFKGGASTANLKVKVPHGDVVDLTDIFQALATKIDWYPSKLTGAVSGDCDVTGGVGLDELEIKARLHGRQWDYFDERLKEVSLTGGYDKGRYYVSDFRGIKQVGSITGEVSYDTQRVLTWKIATQNTLLTDFDHFSKLDVPLRGKFDLSSSGKGRADEISSKTSVRVSEASIRGTAVASSELKVESDHGTIRAEGTALGGQGRGELIYGFAPGAPSSLMIDLKELDFTPLLYLINSQLIHDGAVVGRASGQIGLSFKSGQVERASGLVDISSFTLAKTGSRFDLERAVSARIEGGTISLHGVALRSDRGGVATFSIDSQRGKLDGAVGGDLDTSIIEFLTPTVGSLSGLAHLDFSIGGEVKAPEVLGRATLDSVGLKLASIDSPFESLSGVLELRQNVLTVEQIEAELAGARFLLGGSIVLFANRYPEIDLHAKLAGSKIKMFPFQYARVRGTIGVQGKELPYVINGDIAVDSALVTEKLLQKRSADALKSAQYNPPSNTSDSDYPRFKLDLGVHSDGGVLVKNDLFNAEFKANLRLVNTINAPRPIGTVELIQGKLLFKDREFQIQSATATFDNPTVINPRFSLVANTDVVNTKVQVLASGRVTGQMDQFKVEFSSNPVMAESEILSLLAMGVTTDDATKRFSVNDRSVMQQGEAASMLLNSLDFNREVQSKTGFQIRLDESVNTLVGNSVFRPTADAESIATPRIVIQRKLTDRLGISFGRTVGAGTTTEQEFNAELQLNKGFSLMGVMDSWDSQEGAQNTDNHTLMGVDVKWQKRFP